MGSSVLFPPNLDRFSDNIIGTVILRSTPLSYTHFTPKIQNDESALTTITEDPQMQTIINPHSSTFEAFSTMNTPSKRKRMQNSAPNEPAKKKKKRVVSIEVRRERRRVNMQRYRHKLRGREEILSHKVQRLKEEIPVLQLQRDTIQARGKENTMWNIAAEYFRLFRHGLKEIMESSNVTKGEPLALVKSQTQKGFLYAVLAPNVVGLSGFGVEKLLEDYRTLAFCLPSMSTRLVRLKQGAGGSIHATAKVKCVITENTLRLAFPHLITGGKVSPLAAKLLGQRFVMRGSVHFEWDSDTGRVSLLQAKADLLTPMLERLGDLKVVSSVFKDALITPECTPSRSDE